MSITMSQPGCQPGEKELGPSLSEKQITRGPGGRILTNTGVWSPDSEWIVYDTRSDTVGEGFNGDFIRMVNVRTGAVRDLYQSRNGAHCGVVTFHPREEKVVFILGPENPTSNWIYGPFHRQGVIVSAKPERWSRSDAPSLEGVGDAPVAGIGGTNFLMRGNRAPRAARSPLGDEASPLPAGVSHPAVNLDARDLTPPFTPGALRGGSHVHVWDAAGEWVSFTYEDHVLAQLKEATAENDINLRNVGVSIPGHAVRVSKVHPRNHDGEYFTVVVTCTTANQKPGSDEIKKAYEEAWVGRRGYVHSDGSRQRRALAFQGDVVTGDGKTISEVFLVDLPEDLTQPGDGPLAGTETRMPSPPKGCVQRRLTFTAQRKFPGLQGPRQWLRSSPDGSRIAFLMKDDSGIVQLWTVSPNGGLPEQVTRNAWSIASAFTWSPDGRQVAHVMDNSVCVTDVASGKTRRLTPRTDDATAPRSECCVFSPDGKKVAYIRRVEESGLASNQIFVTIVDTR